ncbi:hypothetical protein KM043_002490 [Ampulex compressa]|nr:hypothetical protein KM043_002490 [Ampulex compressa]
MSGNKGARGCSDKAESSAKNNGSRYRNGFIEPLEVDRHSSSPGLLYTSEGGSTVCLVRDDNTAYRLSCCPKPLRDRRLSYVVMMPNRETGCGPGPEALPLHLFGPRSLD